MGARPSDFAIGVNGTTTMVATRQYLTFGIDRERFALPIERVQEVLDMRPISRLPHAPPYVLGLIDVRGVGLLVIDLRVKFGFVPTEATNRTRIIVVDAAVEGQRLGAGLVADDVIGVGRDGGKFVIVLDLDRLIDTAGLAAASDRVLAA